MRLREIIIIIIIIIMIMNKLIMCNDQA